MSIIEKNTMEIRSVLSGLIGNVTIKTLFTGYGIFYQNDMFGIYQNGTFYLRAKHKLAEYLEDKGAVRWTPTDYKSRLVISNYYELPYAITQNTAVYKQVIIESIQQIKQEKLSESLKMINRIKALPNLSIKHERLLAKVNIYNVKEFKIIGAANTYVRLKKCGFSVNLDFFWNLFAALQNKNVNLLSEKEKESSLKTLNIALDNAGLKPIKENKPDN